MTREEAITVLNMVEAHGSIVIEAKKMAIEALSTSEIPNKWIPVSERLPEEDDYKSIIDILITHIFSIYIFQNLFGK